MVSSAGPFSSATRIFLYMAIPSVHGRRQTEVPVKRLQKWGWHEGIKEQFHVEDNNNRGDGPAEDLDPDRVHKLTHLNFFAGETHQRPDGKAELHGQHDLAGDQQLRGLA